MTLLKKVARLEDFEPHEEPEPEAMPSKPWTEVLPKGPAYQSDLGERFASNGARLLVHKEFDTHVEATPRVMDVSKAFGVGVDESKRFVVLDDLGLRIQAGDIVYVTGQSGGGKSQLLGFLEERLGVRDGFAPLVNGARIETPTDKSLVDSLGSTTDEAIRLLTYVGLNDAFLYLRRFAELSDGQKYRYRLARALDAHARTLVFDEFCSVLDRTTARVVAYLLRRLARETGLTLVVATSHADLVEDLDPDILVHKRIGRDAIVEYREPANGACSLLSDAVVEKGEVTDYEALKEFHYRAGPPAFLWAVYRVRIGDEVVGVICYTTPLSHLAQRYTALPNLKEMWETDPRRYMTFVNANIARIARVVVHPRLRGIGLAVKLVRESMPMTRKKWVETIAAMARFNPFFERAGMRIVTRDDVGESGLTPKWDTFLEKLETLGCEIDYLKSRESNLKWLKGLSPEQVAEVLNIVRRAFTVEHTREQMEKDQEYGPEELAHLLAEYVPVPMSYLWWENADAKVVANQAYLEVGVEGGSAGEQPSPLGDETRSLGVSNPDADLVRELEEAARNG